MLSDLTFNNIIRMVAGKRYYGDGVEEDPEAKQVRQLIADVVTLAGAGNAVDYLPFLRWVSDYEKRVMKLSSRLDEFLQGLVDEKREAKEKGNTMVDHLLSLQENQPDYFTDRIIKGNMLVSIPKLATVIRSFVDNLSNFRKISQSVTRSMYKTIRINQFSSNKLFI